jgi:hypothetical protein
MSIAKKKEKVSERPGIYKLTYPSGQVGYRVQVHGDGKQTSGTFHQSKDAVFFKNTNEHHHDINRLPFTNRPFE